MRTRILRGDLSSVKKDLSEIVFWKADSSERPRQLFDENPSVIISDSIRNVTQIVKAEPDNVHDAMNELVARTGGSLGLRGVGMAIASAFLRFLDPDNHHYSVIDSHAARFLNELKAASSTYKKDPT